jgi:hypothetical protein
MRHTRYTRCIASGFLKEPDGKKSVSLQLCLPVTETPVTIRLAAPLLETHHSIGSVPICHVLRLPIHLCACVVIRRSAIQKQRVYDLID